MQYLKTLLNRNQSWSKHKAEKDPEFFSHLAEGQQPQVLWFGCCDSRVDSNVIVEAELGEVFEQRNIANMVPTDDSGVEATITYALENLEIRRIVVCGHTKCGGVQAAIHFDGLPLNIQKWVLPIYNTMLNNSEQLKPFSDSEEKVWDQLVHLNVESQLENLLSFPVVHKYLDELLITGLVFDVESGELHEVKHLGGRAKEAEAATL